MAGCQQARRAPSCMVDEAYIHISNQRREVYRYGGAGQRRHRPAHLLEALRHGRSARRRGDRAPGSARENSPLQRRRYAHHRHGGATASLKSKTLVPERRKIMGDVREDTFSLLTTKNVEFIPSESNCFMVNAKRSGQGVLQGDGCKRMSTSAASGRFGRNGFASPSAPRTTWRSSKQAFAKVYSV